MPPGLAPATGGGYGANNPGQNYGYQSVNYQPLFSSMLDQSRAAAQMASGGGYGGINPGLINNEYGTRRQINDAGYLQNQLAMNEATRQFQGSTYKWKHGQRDTQLQRGQNAQSMQGLRYKRSGIQSDMRGAKIAADKSRFDVNSAATAAGAFGSKGRGFNIGNINSALAEQLTGMNFDVLGVNTEIESGKLQDKRLAGDLRLGNQMQGLNYGAFQDAGSQFNLANSLTGLNSNLLGNQQQIALANNSNAASNAAQQQAMNQFNVQNTQFNNIMSVLNSMPAGPDKNKLIQDLQRQGRI
jgi:hypothetical protein